MKKSSKKRKLLVLEKTTLRELTSDDMGHVAGGIASQGAPCSAPIVSEPPP